ENREYSMSLILTFLGKGGVGRSVSAIATAKQLAQQGQRVLLVTQDVGPAVGMLMGTSLTPDAQVIEPNLTAVQLKSTVLLQQNWEMVKQLESQYLRDPFFKAVYGQELSVLPGMDMALALNAIREYDASGAYDVIVHDGPGDQHSLRMWGLPEGVDWYFRRFKQVFQSSQFAKAVTPFVQPVAAAVFSNVSFGSDVFDQPQVNQATNMIADGKAAVNNPARVRAYLVSTGSASAIATARYLWGAAQQIGLTVGGVLFNRAEASVSESFAPLPASLMPAWNEGDSWASLMSALPDFRTVPAVPLPMTVDLEALTVTLFLPSFDKKQIELTQYGPEVTVEAGDQRRNVSLPPALQGRSVTGAKFQDDALIISFG
ncbi:MAG: ArsA family ATPase, partial [Cyanobacteria bacterium J06632_22]